MNKKRNSKDIILFIHIFKNAGTSFRRSLLYSFENNQHVPINLGPDHPKALHNLSQKELGKVQLITGHMPFGLHQKLDRPCLYVTFLRNPIDRVLSTYYYLRQDSCKGHPLHEICTNLSLEECFNFKKLSQFSGTQKQLALYHFFNHQTKILAGIKGPPYLGEFGLLPIDSNELSTTKEQLFLAKKNLTSFSWIGFTGGMNRTYSDFARKFNLRQPPDNYFSPEQLMNLTLNKPLRSEISVKTLSAIREANVFDRDLCDTVRSSCSSINKSNLKRIL